MADPRPLTGEQTAAVISYVSAMLAFMTTGGENPYRLLVAKEHMERTLGIKMPYPGEPEPKSEQPTFPNIL